MAEESNGASTRPGRNGFDPDQTKRFVGRIETVMDDIASETGTFMERCKSLRSDIKEIYNEAKEAGIPKKELKRVVKVRDLERKADKAREDLEPKEQETFDQIRHALAIASGKVAMLVQSKFPYSQGRFALFNEHPPARLYFLSTRPSMPPGEKLIAGTVKAEGGKLDYLWMVWDRQRQVGPTLARWLLR